VGDLYPAQKVTDCRRSRVTIVRFRQLVAIEDSSRCATTTTLTTSWGFTCNGGVSLSIAIRPHRSWYRSHWPSLHTRSHDGARFRASTADNAIGV